MTRHFELAEMHADQSPDKYPYIHGIYELQCLPCSYDTALDTVIARARDLCRMDRITEIKECADADLVRLAFGMQYMVQLAIGKMLTDDPESDYYNFCVGMYSDNYDTCKKLSMRESLLEIHGFSQFNKGPFHRIVAIREHMRELEDNTVYDRHVKSRMMRNFIGVVMDEDYIMYGGPPEEGDNPLMWSKGEKYFIMRLYHTCLIGGEPIFTGLFFADLFLSLYIDARGDGSYDDFNFDNFSRFLRNNSYARFHFISNRSE